MSKLTCRYCNGAGRLGPYWIAGRSTICGHCQPATPEARSSPSISEGEVEALIAEAADFTERMTGQPWACELIERLASILASSKARATTEVEVGDTWRNLALQFDGHRIEALSLLRYVSESRNCAEAVGRASEIKAFLAKPPLSGEEVLATRIRTALAGGE